MLTFSPKATLQIFRCESVRECPEYPYRFFQPAFAAVKAHIAVLCADPDFFCAGFEIKLLFLINFFIGIALGQDFDTDFSTQGVRISLASSCRYPFAAVYRRDKKPSPF